MIQFLNSPEDVAWLAETHLRDITHPPFASFIISGNEDAPDFVRLFPEVDPKYTDKGHVIHFRQRTR